VIVLPPLDVGADHVTTADALPRLAATPFGAPGIVAGVTAGDADDASPMPTVLVAVTVKVYESPFVRPETVQVSGPLNHPQVSLPRAGAVASAAVTL
jgi:hypothetical protein